MLLVDQASRDDIDRGEDDVAEFADAEGAGEGKLDDGLDRDDCKCR